MSLICDYGNGSQCLIMSHYEIFIYKKFPVNYRGFCMIQIFPFEASQNFNKKGNRLNVYDKVRKTDIIFDPGHSPAFRFFPWCICHRLLSQMNINMGLELSFYFETKHSGLAWFHVNALSGFWMPKFWILINSKRAFKEELYNNFN